MPAKHFSLKQLQIDKASAKIVIFTGLATAMLVFTGFGVKAMLSQRAYQSKVIGQKEKAKKQLEANIRAKDALVTSYEQFTAGAENVLGGSATGEGENDGDNARIVLDALPSKYDFPALATSLEKMLNNHGNGLKLESITGTDDEIAQAEATNTTPKPVEMPFELSVSGTYNSMKSLVDAFERSIRPFNITALSLSGSENTMRLDVTAKTYYQPEKKVNIQMKEVR